MLYHPDKNNDDTYTAAHFNEIKEAYEVLTNPEAREQYLQQRWYKKATGVWMPDEPITPPLILKQALELNKSISLLDVHRMDAASVSQRILQLIPDETIEKIKSFNEPDINAAIITTLLQSTSVLPFQHSYNIAQQLRKLAEMNSDEHLKIDRVLQKKKIQNDWERYKSFFIIITVVALCFIIYMSIK